MSGDQRSIEIKGALIFTAGQGQVGHQPINRFALRAGGNRHAQHLFGLIEPPRGDRAAGLAERN